MAAKKTKKTANKLAKKPSKKAARRPAKKLAKKPAKSRGPKTTVIEFRYGNLIKPLAGATAKQLAAIERHFGGALPSDYADFLRGLNGGGPQPSLVGKPRDGFNIEAFYGAGSKSDAYDVLKASQRASKAAGSNVVAIAGDGSGDQLIFLKPGDAGVYHWVHDELGKPRRVAKSFSRLLASLTELPQ
jgi:hypothetical protein